MKLFVAVKSNSKKPGIEQIDSVHFIVRVKEMPLEGKANMAVIKVMSEFLNIPSSSLELVSGKKSKNKILSRTF